MYVLSKDVERIILKHALINAIKHDGKAILKPVISKVIGERPDLRSSVKEVYELTSKIIEYVNSLSPTEQRRKLAEYSITVEELEKREVEVKELPPLPNAEKYKVVRTRFAPNPDFVLTLGNARPAVLSYEYAVKYNGNFILRFEDTDPKTKPPILEAYNLIREDLKWLGIKWDLEVIQSKRMEIYYEYAEKLIELRGAYVCTCSRKEFKALRDSMKPCPHREHTVSENKALWNRMLMSDFNEGEAVLRVKTDLNHPDPSIRDWVAFRIIDTERHPHPLTGSKYVVWPTYNFACGIDDHLLEITHILRAKEHVQNTVKQTYLYKHFSWNYPTAIHFGRLKFSDFILSKSKIRRFLEENPQEFEGYDDVRFGTLRALRRRGIQPEAIRQIMIEVGIKPSEATISMKNIAAANRKLLDPIAPRLMFVESPVKVLVKNLDSIRANIPLHPSNTSLGSRSYVLEKINGTLELYISFNDVPLFKENKLVRLMGLMNVAPIRVSEDVVVVEFKGVDVHEARKAGAPIIQWCPPGSLKAIIKKPEGLVLREINGIIEPYVEKIGVDSVVQLIRFGFARIEKYDNGAVIIYYGHN